MKRLSLAIIFACCTLAMAAQERYRTGESQPEGWTIIVVTGQDDAAKAEWWPLSNLPHLAFDHYDIMQDAITAYVHITDTKDQILESIFAPSYY